jgi:hypothetical protein
MSSAEPSLPPFSQRCGVVLVLPKEKDFDKLFWEPRLPHRQFDNDALIEVRLDDLGDGIGDSFGAKYGDKLAPSVEERIRIQESKGEPFVPGQGVNEEFKRLYLPHYGKALSSALGPSHRLLSGIEGAKYAPPYFCEVYPNVDLLGFASIGGVDDKKDANEAEGPASSTVFPMLCLHPAADPASSARGSTSMCSISLQDVLRLARTASRELVEETGILIPPSLMVEFLESSFAALNGAGGGGTTTVPMLPVIVHTGPSPYYEKKSIVIFTIVVPAASYLTITMGKICKPVSAAPPGASAGAAEPRSGGQQKEPFVIVSNDDGRVLITADRDGVVISHPKYLGRQVALLSKRSET